MDNKKSLQENSDYSKVYTDINQLIPQSKNTGILQSINSNLFNRPLTKSENERVVGLIGDVTETTSYEKISEPTEYRTQNQLQPVVTSNIGTEMFFTTFEDFLKKIERTGVSTERFDEWGNALKFNWTPPINPDKFVNYSDYYWLDKETDKRTTPNYITVENVKNSAEQRYRSIEKYFLSKSNSYELVEGLTNDIYLRGDMTQQLIVGSKFLLSGANYETTHHEVVSTNYNPAEDKTIVNCTPTPVQFNELRLTITEVPIDSIVNDTTIIIKSDYTNLLYSGFILSAHNSTTGYTEYLSIDGSTYNNQSNLTTIVFNQQIDISAGLNILNLRTMVDVYKREYDFHDGDVFISPTEVDYLDLKWHRGIIMKGDDPGNDIILGDEFLTDFSHNFVLENIEKNDKLIINDGPNKGEFVIDDVQSNTVVLNEKLFSQVAPNYKIVRPRAYDDLTTEPTVAQNSVIWIDEDADAVKQYDTTDYVIKFKNISVLESIILGKNKLPYEEIDNDWSRDNKWVHYSDISTFAGAIRATAPIIEYSPFVEISDMSFTEHAWSYRKTSDKDYIKVDDSPNIFELLNIEYGTTRSFSILTSNSIKLSPKCGNLTKSINPGDNIVLAGFNTNNGSYTVSGVDFSVVNVGEKPCTIITLVNDLADVLDLPNGATIAPEFNSMGDLHQSDQWLYRGIKTVRSSSRTVEKNIMLCTSTTSYTTNGGTREVIVGHTWQEVLFKNSTTNAPSIDLDASLHNISLLDDYQEGDIRVYINDRRVYGTYTDGLGDSINYVKYIKFDNRVVLNKDDVVRIELGAYNNDEIGMTDVPVNLGDKIEPVSLVTDRKVEQHKSKPNEYIEFKVYDINGNPLEFTSKIFQYKEDNTKEILPEIGKRVDYNAVTRDYVFVNLLHDNESGELYAYKDVMNSEIVDTTIWKRGMNYEQYVPRKENGIWEFPDTIYYNLSHENKKDISYRELYKHFTTIVNSQQVEGINSDFGGVGHVVSEYNYGNGGTIREYNDGFDHILSFVHSNNISVDSVLSFGQRSYLSQQRYVKDVLRDNVHRFILDANFPNIGIITDEAGGFVRNTMTTSDRWDKIYGDSTPTLQNAVYNWVITLPMMGIVEPRVPHKIKVSNNVFEVLAHDGHRIPVNFTHGERIFILNRLVENGAYHIADNTIPTDNSGVSWSMGDVVVLGVGDNLSVFRMNINLIWEKVTLESILADLILDIETDLYQLARDNYVKTYSNENALTSIEYSDYKKARFAEYVKSNNISQPFSSLGFYKENKPFTWNYANSIIQNHPLSGVADEPNQAYWKALYYNVYNTPYPHLEPWRLQWYENKPSWWDATYKDDTGTRKWKPIMWQNIKDGVVPNGNEVYNGQIGTGNPGDVTNVFSYIPVNIANSPTLDGIYTDELIPPYWDSTLALSTYTKPLFDINQAHVVKIPDENYDLGQFGPIEWDWFTSSYYNYDNAIISYQLQPVRFTLKTFGYELVNVNCLQVDSKLKRNPSHHNILFNGDYEDGRQIEIRGLNQLYVQFNRFSGYDSQMTDFRISMVDWVAKLSYTLGTFTNFRNIKLTSFGAQLTDKDYTWGFKKTEFFDEIEFSGIGVKPLTVPSKYSKYRDNGIGWNFEVSTLTRSNEITYFKPQNYSFTFDGEEIYVNRYNLASAKVQDEYGYQKVVYNNNLSKIYATAFQDDNTLYKASVTFDGSDTVSLELVGEENQTLSEVITNINTQMGGYGFIFFNNGNLIIRSETTGVTSSVSLIDAGLFASLSSDFLYIESPKTTNVLFEKVFLLDGNMSLDFSIGDTITVHDSTEFNGTYTVHDVYYDRNKTKTGIRVNEDVNITSTVVDGYISTDTEIHPDWVDGTEVYFTGSKELPKEIDTYLPYYIKRVSDTVIKIAENPSAVESGNFITLSSLGDIGSLWVGRIENTFGVLGGNNTGIKWRKHFPDKRSINTISSSETVSGVQNFIDIVLGYDEFLADRGIVLLNDGRYNIDSDTSRVVDWQYELEKAIDAFYSMRTIRQQDFLTYNISFDSVKNVIVVSGNSQYFPTGTRVQLKVDTGSKLPESLDYSAISVVPFYVIHTNVDGEFKLARSKDDALEGVFIDISDDGVGTFSVNVSPHTTELKQLTLNPYVDNVWVRHEQGVLRNVFKRHPNSDTSSIFSYMNNRLEADAIEVYRNDKLSHILSHDSKMVGGNIGLDSYEHILQFENYSSDGNLLFDAFLGLNKENFLVEFDRGVEYTLRPNVGGRIVYDGNQIQNFESAIDDLREFYSMERVSTVDSMMNGLVQESFGYPAVTDYMTSVDMTEKSQFMFWKGAIQQKGTTTAIDAFTNRDSFKNAELDEFWVFKVGEFGDESQKVYPEMKMITDDVVRDEMRIEFVESDGGQLDMSFTPVELGDTSRWWNQPNQLEINKPYDTFFLNAGVVEVYEDVRDLIVGAGDYVELEKECDYAVILEYDNNYDNNNYLVSGTDYELYNKKFIKFKNSDVIDGSMSLKVTTLSYDYDAQNPGKIIDKLNGTVVKQIPIWNPRAGQYYHNAIHLVDIKTPNDPAKYNTEGDVYSWSDKYLGTVWFDDGNEGYVPYNDVSVYPKLNDRLLNWGKQAEWSEIKLYKWVKSDKPPEEYVGDGVPRQNLYKDNAGTWELQKDLHEEYYKFKVTPGTTSQLTGIVEVYVNGKYESDFDLDSGTTLYNYISSFDETDIVHLLKRKPVPTETELEDGDYKYETPVTIREKFDITGKNSRNVYYFWVRDSKDTKWTNEYNNPITSYEAEKQLNYMPHPYMIPEGFKTPDRGYGLIFGHVFDEFDNDLPYRYTQMVVRGLRDTVKANDRYVFRFTKDSTLRDRLGDDSLELKNIHTEWKLIREKQSNKIDKKLWDGITESILGYKYDNGTVDYDKPIPETNRVIYDEQYNTFTRYGFSETQAMVDSELAKDTIDSIIYESNRGFEQINIISFRESNTFDTDIDIINTMETIYSDFTATDVNYIFFQILLDMFTVNKEVSHIFKTSWASLKVSYEVESKKTCDNKKYISEIGGNCG